jgi:CHASE2 domain-containing sensor protein
MEVVGAILLLPRRTRKVGATLLLASLAFACAFHALSGEWPPLAFLVYAPAIVLVATPC